MHEKKITDRIRKIVQAYRNGLLTSNEALDEIENTLA